MKDLESVTRDRNINEFSCTLSAVSIKMRTDIGSWEVNDSIPRLKCVYVWRPSNSQTYHITERYRVPNFIFVVTCPCSNGLHKNCHI